MGIGAQAGWLSSLCDKSAGQGQVGCDLKTWTWRYRLLDPLTGHMIRSTGVLLTDADPDGDHWYDVLALQGRQGDDHVTGLVPGGQSIPGNAPFAGDNKIRRLTLSSLPQLSSKGIQYGLAGNSFVNVFYTDHLDPPGYREFHSRSPFPDGVVAPNTEVSVEFVLVML